MTSEANHQIQILQQPPHPARCESLNQQRRERGHHRTERKREKCVAEAYHRFSETGTVEIDGLDWELLNTENRQRLRRMFGMVFQDAALFDSLTIGENIALPMEIRKDIPLSTHAIQQKISSLLSDVGLAGDSQRRTMELSGGMQKRAGIARALAVNPDILLYDEPTAGLDGSTAERISRLMHQVNQNHPEVTSVTVTHDYLCAALVADRILFLDKQTGKLQEFTSEIEKIKERSRVLYAEKVLCSKFYSTLAKSA